MNIAIVKLSSVGDVVHALPVAMTLRARWPDAHLCWVAERREATVLAGHPALDEVIPIDTRLWRRARSPQALLGAVDAVVRFRHRVRRRFDVAIDLQGLMKSGVVTAAIGAPLRIGFAARHCWEPLAALFTNRRIMPPRAARHVVEQNLALLAPLGVREPVVEFGLPRDLRAEQRIDDFLVQAGLKAHRRVVVLNPGAGQAGKRWPLERFQALARRLADEAAASVIVVWGPGEEAEAKRVAGAPARVVVAPATDLRDLIALLRRASLVVAADTGPIHLAAAVGTPCLGLYGPTEVARNGPWGPRNRTLEAPGRDLRRLDLKAVHAAAVELLG